MKIDSIKIMLILAEKGMTKTDLARKANISRQSISTITNRGTCSPKNVGRIAAALGVHASDIIQEVR